MPKRRKQVSLSRMSPKNSIHIIHIKIVSLEQVADANDARPIHLASSASPTHQKLSTAQSKKNKNSRLHGLQALFRTSFPDSLKTHFVGRK